jgi:hypothetical protein
MNEKEYESLYEALVAAHKILPVEKDCGKTEADFRRKIRKLEKAVLKRQKKLATRAASKARKANKSKGKSVAKS